MRKREPGLKSDRFIPEEDNSLNWDREALDNGDGPSTVIAYDEEGNELFYCRDNKYNQWRGFVTFGPNKWRLSQRIEFIFDDRESAEKICEYLHELAEINHGYK